MSVAAVRYPPVSVPGLRDLTVRPAEAPWAPAGLQRIDYTSGCDGRADWALAWPGADATRWVVHLHGHGSTGDQLHTRPDINRLWLPRYRAAGLGVLSPNLRGNAWMSPAAAHDLHALLEAVRRLFGPARFLFFSGSMGGTGNLIYAVLHPEDVQALGAMCPAVDIASYYGWCRERNTGVIAQIADAIRADYGGEPTDRPEVYAAHSALAHGERLTMPAVVVHGDADAIIPVEPVRELAGRMAGRATFRYEELPGGHHDSPLESVCAIDWAIARL